MSPSLRPAFSVLAGCLIFLTGNAGIRAQHANATLSDFAWLVGRWTGPGLGGTSEEIWTGPGGGSMQGMYRLLRDGKIVFYEILTLTEKDGSVVLRLKHFNPDLTGWEEKGDLVEFPLVKVTPTEAHFKGMVFSHPEKDAFSVLLTIEDRKTGKVREERFTYTRVKP